MYGTASDPAPAYRHRYVNYSRPAVHGNGTATGRANDARIAPASGGQGDLRRESVYRSMYDPREVEEEDDEDDNSEDDDDDKDDDIDTDNTFSLRPNPRSSFDSEYASTETSARLPIPSSRSGAEKHIVCLHRRPATTVTTLKVSEQRYDPTTAHKHQYNRPDTTSSTPVPRPRAPTASQPPPRPISLAFTYRPAPRLSTTSTANSDTITPASYRKSTRLSAAALKPLDLTRTISSNLSSASAPAASPLSLGAPQPPSSSQSARELSSHPKSPSMRPSPRTPAVVMYTTHFDDEEEQRDVGRKDSATSGVASSGGGSSVTGEGERPWQISDCDYSGLSEKQIQKLRKRGINPALYVEMQAARKGAGRIGTLSGNTYLS